MDGLEVESRWGEIFPNASRPSMVPSHRPILWVRDLFPRGKAAGTWRWHPHLPPPIAEFKEEYLPSPPWAMMVCSRVNFTLVNMPVNQDFKIS
jgi:hypothetical protein